MAIDPNPGELEPESTGTPGSDASAADVGRGAPNDTPSPELQSPITASQVNGHRYIVQRTEAGRALGQIMAETEAGFSVVINGAKFQWDRLPNSVHEVAEGSLELDSLLDIEGIRASFAEQPAAVVARLLRDRGQPLEAGEIQLVLEAFEILAPGEAKARWKDLQKTLVKHAHITRVGKPVRYAWSDDPVVEVAAAKKELSVAELLELVAKPSAKGRTDALQLLTEKDAKGELSASQRQLAVVLGGVAGNRESALAELDITQVPAPIAPVVVSAAVEFGLWGVVLGFAADARTTVSTAALAAFEEAPAEDQRRSLVEWFAAAELLLTTPDPRAHREVQRWLELAQTLMPLEPDPTVARSVMALAIAVATGYLEREVRGPLVEELMGLLAAHGAVPQHVLSALPSDRRKVEAFQHVLRKPSGGHHPGRIFWYRVVLRSDHVDLFERDGAFNLLDLDGLRDLFSDPELQVLLEGHVAAGVETQLRMLVELAPLPDVLAFIEGAPARLVAQIRTDRLAQRLRTESESESLLSRALGRFAATHAGELESRVRAEVAAELEEYELGLLAAKEQIVILEAELASQQAARVDAENRVVQLSRQSKEAASHGLEQARLDALRAVVNIVEDLRRVAAAPDGEVLSVADLHLGASTQAQVLGVSTLEQAGDTVPFDPSRHRLIDQARPQDGTPQVRVIEPTYVVQSGDAVTVLRYGRVTGS